MPGTLLVVDDDEDLRETLTDLLTVEGYTVATAANGAEALAYLRGNPRPALILLDLIMPVMDGWQFRREQQRDPDLADIPTVVLTAVAEFELGRGNPGTLILPKPVDLHVLFNTVRRYCR